MVVVFIVVLAKSLVVVTMWKLGAGAYSSMVEVVRWVGDNVDGEL